MLGCFVYAFDMIGVSLFPYKLDGFFPRSP
jgi:hypothetical protein